MKKSLFLVLSLPLLLASCELKMGGQTSEQKPQDQTTQTDDQSGQGTEGSTTGGEGHSGGFHPGGGSHSGGDTTGGGTTGGETETGGQTTGGGSETGGETQSTSTTVSKAMSDCGFVNAKDVNEFNLADDLKVSLSKGSNTQNGPKYYESDTTLRIYGGNTVTFTASSNITKIKLQITSDSGDNGISPSTGSISSDRTTWTGYAKSVTLTVLEKSGKICITSISTTYGGSGESTGGGTTGGETTGGGTSTGGGETGQSGNGNTSSEWTTPWTGKQYDIAYSLFKGNLPCLKAFNGFAVGCVDGSTKMYFNPFIKGWSKESQTYYDGALRDMGYTKVDQDTDEDGVEWFYYEKGTYYVQTSHYRGDDGEYYFDVYAYNDYEAPFKLDYEPIVDLTTDVYPIKSSYKQFSKTINGITFACSWCTENSSFIQLAKDSTMEITSSTALSKMDISFNYEKSCCLVYAGTSSSTAKIVYNNGNHWDLPSGTKYVRIQTLKDNLVQIDCLSIK